MGLRFSLHHHPLRVSTLQILLTSVHTVTCALDLRPGPCIRRFTLRVTPNHLPSLTTRAPDTPFSPPPLSPCTSALCPIPPGFPNPLPMCMLPGTYVHNAEVGNGPADSLLMPMNQQVEELCKGIYADDKLKDGFNLIGFSQGTCMCVCAFANARVECQTRTPCRCIHVYARTGEWVVRKCCRAVGHECPSAFACMLMKKAIRRRVVGAGIRSEVQQVPCNQPAELEQPTGVERARRIKVSFPVPSASCLWDWFALHQ